MIPRGGPGTVVPTRVDRGVVVVTGTTLHDRRTAYCLAEACGPRLRGWIMLPERERADMSGPTTPALGGGGLRRHLRRGPAHLVRLARSLPRRMRERRALRRWPRALAGAEHRLLAEEVEAHGRRATLSPQRLGDPACPALADALRAANPGLVVAAEPGLVSPEVAASWDGPILSVYAGWSPRVRGEAPVEQALYRRSLDELGATVHLLTEAGELGPLLRRSHPCLVPWDTPESVRQRVLALGTELLCEVVRETLERGELVTYDPPIEPQPPRVAHLDGRLLAALRDDHRRGWLSAALRDARRF